MCLEACEDPTSPGVWWRDDTEWKQYDVSKAAAIERGIADGASRVDLGSVSSLKYTGGARYVVDLCTMKQINLGSNYTRDVKIIKVPGTSVTTPAADYKSVQEELRACGESIRSLKDIVLKLGSELLAVKSQIAENEAKRVKADAATANQVAFLKSGCAPAISRSSVREGRSHSPESFYSTHCSSDYFPAPVAAWRHD
ncbi:hypothetical protein M758_8G055800 [Ceratodon purpureus]|nr:hypothetical protein M758_8G055800 [Ceratodon purpureus]